MMERAMASKSLGNSNDRTLALSGWKFDITGEREATPDLVASVTASHHMKWIMAGAHHGTVRCMGRGYVLD
jgi:hypothetical protein